MGKAPAPLPILTDVGGWEGREIGWYIDGLKGFVEVAMSSIERRPEWRAKPLLAVPLIGTGAGGSRERAGELQMALLSSLAVEAAAHDVDIVLSLNDEEAYCSAQSVRRKRWQWPLAERERALLDNLADRARRNELVLFIGAGLSIGAGLPSWNELLEQLAQDSQLDRTLLESVPLLDVATMLERRLGGAEPFRRAVAELTSAPCFGLGHALTAAFPVTERVTTNYDDCVEQSLTAVGRKPSILPYQPNIGGAGWLLKMHGTITNPNDIVLTRQDYLRYANRRGALHGIVQAMLLTRHILFLGFSLKDDNFHVLIDEVRFALEGLQGTTDGCRFGTALVPPASKGSLEFWESDINIEVVGEEGSYPRALEIALDYLGFASTSAIPHLLVERYDAILTEEEKELKSLARDIEERISNRQLASATFEPIAKLLKQLGSTRANGSETPE